MDDDRSNQPPRDVGTGMPGRAESPTYEAPVDRATPQRIGAQAVAGAAMTAVLTVAAIAGLLFLGYYVGATRPTSSAGDVITFAAPIALVVGLLIVADRLRRSPTKRGFAFGIWIGLAIAALVEGACYVLQK